MYIIHTVVFRLHTLYRIAIPFIRFWIVVSAVLQHFSDRQSEAARRLIRVTSCQISWAMKIFERFPSLIIIHHGSQLASVIKQRSFFQTAWCGDGHQRSGHQLRQSARLIGLQARSTFCFVAVHDSLWVVALLWCQDTFFFLCGDST